MQAQSRNAPEVELHSWPASAQGLEAGLPGA